MKDQTGGGRSIKNWNRWQEPEYEVWTRCGRNNECEWKDCDGWTISGGYILKTYSRYVRNSSLSIFDCFIIEINVPGARYSWYGTVTSVLLSSCHKWIWLPDCLFTINPALLRAFILCDKRTGRVATIWNLYGYYFKFFVFLKHFKESFIMFF